MGKKLKCNHDCFNCIFDDCINDYVYSEKGLYKYRSEQAKANQRALAKKARDEAREKGLCLVCRKKKATHGAKCYECYLRQKRYDKAKCSGDREEWMENGRCYFCGERVFDGHKVCKKHYVIYKHNADLLNAHENTINARKTNRIYFGRK